MANYFEKVSVFIDVKAEKAAQGLSKFRASIKEAEGFTAKLKAGLSGIGDAAKAATSSPLALAGTITAVGGAAFKVGEFLYGLADDFKKTALEADNMGKAVGLSAEEASRWIAIGDDVGLTAEDMTKSLGKITKSLGTAPFDKWGIQTRDSTGKARSMNEILIDTVGTLGMIADPTARATAGTELLGKAYATIAPLVGKSKEEIRQYLATVDAGQVVTDAQVAKAKELQKAQDNINDTVKEGKKTLGDYVALPAANWLSDLNEKLRTIAHPTEWWNTLIGKTNAQQAELEKTMAYGAKRVQAMSYAEGLEAKALLEVTRKREAATEAAVVEANQVQHLRDVTKALVDERLREVDGVQTVERAQLSEADALNNLNKVTQDATDVSKDHTKTNADRAQAMRDVRKAQLDATNAIVDTAKAEAAAAGYADGSSDSLRTEISYLEDAAKKYPLLKDEIEKYIAALKKVPGYMDTPGTFKTPDFAHGGGPGGTSLTGGPTINITVNGALDANAVARQIDRMLATLYKSGGGLGVSTYGRR